MIVRDLIKLLADLPPEAEVLVDDDGVPRPFLIGLREGHAVGLKAGAEAMRDLVIDYLGGNGSLEQIARVRALPLPVSASR